MAPKMIEMVCPNCTFKNKPIPAGMGDKTIKCRVCGKFIHYGFRKNEIKIVDRPDRTSDSGLVLY